ncbi:hypothetical protein D3C86_1861890 [compost metagenome]
MLERSYYTIDTGGNNTQNKNIVVERNAFVYDTYVDVERGINSSVGGSGDCYNAYLR